MVIMEIIFQFSSTLNFIAFHHLVLVFLKLSVPPSSSNDILDFLVFSQDVQNLKSRVQKQLDFEEELAANRIMLNNLEKTGQEMIENGHYASDAVAARMNEVANLWKELLEATEQRG